MGLGRGWASLRQGGCFQFAGLAVAASGRHCVTAFVSPVPVVRVAGGGRLGGGSGWQRRLGMVGLVGGG